MCDAEKKKGREKWCMSKNKRIKNPLFFLRITSQNKRQHSTVLLFCFVFFLKKRSLENVKIHKSDLHSETKSLSTAVESLSEQKSMLKTKYYKSKNSC